MDGGFVIVFGGDLEVGHLTGRQFGVGEGQASPVVFESNSIYYQDDSGLGAAGTAPDDRFGSNNYMKLDYMNGRFFCGTPD